MISIGWVWHTHAAMVRTIGLLLALAVGGCAATTTALEAQNRPLDPGKGRIYVMRLDAWNSSALHAEIKINDVDVGSLGNQSHLSVDRPPGRYKLSARMQLDLAPIEHNVQVTAGRTYYFVLNLKPTQFPIVAGNGAVVGMIPIPSPNMGQRVEKENLGTALFSSAFFGELDAKDGAAELQRLKPP